MMIFPIIHHEDPKCPGCGREQRTVNICAWDDCDYTYLPRSRWAEARSVALAIGGVLLGAWLVIAILRWADPYVGGYPPDVTLVSILCDDLAALWRLLGRIV